jgi:hypothetical protein
MSMFINTPLKLDIPILKNETSKKPKTATTTSLTTTSLTATSLTTVEIILVEKTGTLKSLKVKDFKEEELFKKCGFKKIDGFEKQTEWTIKMDGKKYYVSAFAKSDGKANSENKYDFPPPIDSKLFFGTCALICKTKNEDKSFSYMNLSVALWTKMYEKLFGGFEDLTLTCIEDDTEIDELDAIPADKKTKQGYLKDGFVVDSEDTEDDDSDDENCDDDDDDDDKSDGSKDEESDLDMEDIGSELSEDAYDYSDDEPTK